MGAESGIASAMPTIVTYPNQMAGAFRLFALYKPAPVD
jgi:hypothetical protein